MSLKRNIRIFVALTFALTLGSFGTALAERPVAGNLELTASNPTISASIASPEWTADEIGCPFSCSSPLTYLYNIETPISLLSSDVHIGLSVTAADLNTAPVAVFLDENINNSGEMLYSAATSTWGYQLTDPAGFVLGAHNLRMTFMDDDNTNPIPVTIRYQIVKAGQLITFNALTDAAYRSSFVLPATSDSGLPITYTILAGGSGTATLSYSGATGLTTLTPTGVGTVIVEATQAGNEVYTEQPR